MNSRLRCRHNPWGEFPFPVRDLPRNPS
jgi:hypothetical protein